MKPRIRHVSLPLDGGCAGAILSTHWGLSSAMSPAGASVASLSLSFIVLRCDAWAGEPASILFVRGRSGAWFCSEQA